MPIPYSFPIQEYGMNLESQPLQPHEITAMKADTTVVQRVISSYQLMLDFYGMRLETRDTGLLVRSSNYAERYKNLVRESASVHPCCRHAADLLRRLFSQLFANLAHP